MTICAMNVLWIGNGDHKKGMKIMDSAKSELIKMAAEMAMCKNMPSWHFDDWGWPKGMQVTSWRKVFDSATKAEDQCKGWAIRLRKIADTL